MGLFAFLTEWHQCRGCAALRDEVADLRAERNLLRQELLDSLRKVSVGATLVRSDAERIFKPVPTPTSGWNKLKGKFEDKYKRVPGVPTNEDKVAEYWKSKQAQMESDAALHAVKHQTQSDAAAIEEELSDASGIG